MTNLSQVSLEAMYSTAYVENYMDCVENLPDDLQRIMSRLRELDCTYRSYLRDVEQHTDIIDFENVSVKKAKRLQTLLISAQEVGDEKLQLVQQLQDLIDYRTRKLEVDYKNLDLGKEEILNELKESQPPANNVIPIATNANNQNNERQSKRARRTRQETLPSENSTNVAVIEPTTPTEHTLRSSQTTPITATQKKSTTGTGKKKKRKARGASAAAHQAAAVAAAAAAAAAAAQIPREDSPPKEDENAIDPDEPTYCLCDQISFGEMILCDNDLCPIEWFHFQCVALTTKPKGKWFCPKCRGDRPNVMKPKAQFLKELERYNKEKEEKT